MCKWLASIWNENMYFSSILLKYRGIWYAYFLGVFKPRKLFASCNFSHVKYFQMLEIPILLPLLFRTDFSGYRGLQYVHNFLVFWVISNFFKYQKSHYSRHGLPMNSHANFTYSFPKLKIIVIPTMTRSNCFWFISLIACTGRPMPKTLLLCDIDLLVARDRYRRTHPKNFWLSWSILFGVCTLLAEFNHLLVGACTLLAEIEHCLVQ